MPLHAWLHLVLHLAVPAAIAWLCFRSQWKWALAIMLLGLLIDVDHLLARPVYDPNRSSIGFHPLHRLPAILVYVLLLFPRCTRILGIGLIVHIALDALDGAMR